MTTILERERGMPSLAGASEWLNSQPLTPADLQGRAVLIDFGTYTCINWLRTLPHIRAWAEKYREHGLVVIGIQTPEFEFEHNLDSVRREVKARLIDWPVAVDNHYEIWRAFSNHYWPALYFVDRQGVIRHHHFGEGRYEESERVIQQLLGLPRQDLVSVHGKDDEADADWQHLNSPETYLGYERTDSFASPGGIGLGESRVFAAPDRLRLNQWALSGDWTIGADRVVLNDRVGRILFRFHARDVHLVLQRPDGRNLFSSASRLTASHPAPRMDSISAATATVSSTTTASTSSSASQQPWKSAPSRSSSTCRASRRTCSPSAREEQRCAPSSPAASAAAATTRPATAYHRGNT